MKYHLCAKTFPYPNLTSLVERQVDSSQELPLPKVGGYPPSEAVVAHLDDVEITSAIE